MYFGCCVVADGSVGRSTADTDPAVVQSGWTMLTAEATRGPLVTVDTEAGVATTAYTEKTYRSPVLSFSLLRLLRRPPPMTVSIITFLI